MGVRAITYNDNTVLSGDVGTAYIEFNGYDFGPTRGGITISKDEDYLDVINDQTGTKKTDEIRTGGVYMVKANFSNVGPLFYQTIVDGITDNSVTGEQAMVIGESVYTSRRSNFAGVLKILRAVGESGGYKSDAAQDVITFYEATAKITGDYRTYGPGDLRQVEVEFCVYYHTFTEAERVDDSVRGAYGYLGSAGASMRNALVPAAIVPDREGPQVSSASATSATQVSATFNRNVAFQGGTFDAEDYVVRVQGANLDKFVVPTLGSISSGTAVLLLTFPASSFAAGNTLSLTISSTAIQDTAATPVLNRGVDSFTVANNI